MAAAQHEYTTSTTIHADPETVWLALTDAATYADWNPEIVGIDGTMSQGARIKVRVKLGNGAIRTLGLRVTRFEAPRRMEWIGGLPLGLFVGTRVFTVARGEDATEFRMDLRMHGLLSPLILKSVGDRQPEIDGFSQALKRRAEHLRAVNSGSRTS
jgi:hypothetical protein